ncbi:MAG: hypothetical protein KAX47_06090, partial [Zoogloea sp.]|nr:hypothetical protein [Zoogloea sp.]
MNTTLFPCAPVAASSTFEQRVARGLTWGLFVALWGKLLVSVLLTQPVIDAEAESLYNRLADALLLGVLLAGLLTYADAILRRAPLMLAVVPFGLASFLTTELLSGLNFSTAVFEYLKIVTPALMSVLLLRLFEREPALAIRLMKATLALIWGLVIVALIFLPPSLNRGGELFWPV